MVCYWQGGYEMRLWELTALALSLVYGRRTAMDAIPCSHATIERVETAAEKQFGFRFSETQHYQRSGVIPTPKGRAWATVALTVMHKAREVEQIAAGLQDWQPKQKPRITLDEMLAWQSDGRSVVERWLKVRLFGPLGFLTMNGDILRPSLDELCQRIRQLYQLQEQMREPQRTTPTQVA